MNGIESLTAWLTDADRGVSEVIGAILVFGLVVGLLAILQVQAVPSANEEIEFKHSQEVRGEMDALQAAVDETAESGRTNRRSVNLGTTYPTRMLFYNPPDATGELHTTRDATITIDNVTSESDASKLYDALNNRVAYSTRAIVYRTDYHEFENDVRYVREPSVYYRNQSGTTFVEGSTFIDGTTITLVSINGSLDERGVTGRTVETEPLSAPMQEHEVRTDGSGPIRIAIPTKLSPEKWNETLSDEYARDADPIPADVSSVSGHGSGNVESAEYVATSDEFNYVVVSLDPSTTYTLRTGQVGVGNSQSPGPEYTVPVEEDGNQAVVEVRDRFNNPVSGVELEARVTGGSGAISNGLQTGQTITVTTGPGGRASVTRPSGSGAVAVEFGADLNGDGSIEPAVENATAYFEGGVAVSQVNGTATNADGVGEVTFELENRGPERGITSIDVGYITLYETNTNVDISQIGEGSLTQDITAVSDGPDAVEAVHISGSGSSDVFSATEGTGPTPVPKRPSLPASTTSDVTLVFDEDYSVDSEQDAIAVEVTITFDDGASETYDVMLFNEEM